MRADDGPKTVQELIARAKANPGKLNYGAGIITTRLAGYLFNREAGIDVQYIPFNGSAADGAGPADRRGRLHRRWHRHQPAADPVAANCARSPSSTAGRCRHCRRCRPLAVEAGIPALDDISTWIGLVAPAGTPRGIVDKIQREVVKMYADPVIAEKLRESRHQRGQQHAGGIRRLRAQGTGPLGPGLQG